LIINILQIMNIIYTVRLIRSGGVCFDSTYQWHADIADGPKIDNVDVTVACQIITCTVEIVTTGGRIVFFYVFLVCVSNINNCKPAWQLLGGN